MPAGTYDATVTGGTLGLGLLPSLIVPAATTFPLTVGTTPVNANVDGFTLPAQPINESFGVGSVTGTYTITVQTLGLQLDPATGDATIDTGGYVTLALTLTPVIGSPTSGNCTLGTDQTPIALHLSSANPGGSAWNATTHVMTLVDNTFVVPTVSCDPSLSVIAALLDTVIGSKNPGDNNLLLNLLMVRRPDQTQTTTQGGGTTGGGQGTTQTPTSGGGQTPTGSTPNAAAPRCVVPKLKGKSFKTRKAKKKVKTRLKKSGCRLGKVKKVKSKKRKGTVLRQSPRAGKKLTKGARVKLIVSRGPH